MVNDMHITTYNKDEFQGTIKLNKMQYGLGPMTDVDGKRWDVRGHFGNWVQAVPMENLHSYYTDTSGNDGQYFNMGTAGSNVVSQKWRPYKLEIVDE